MERKPLAAILAQNIRDLLAARDMSAAELGRRAGMNYTAAYDILSGKSRNPRLDTVERIAGALGVAPLILLEDRPLSELADELTKALARLSDQDRQRLLDVAIAWAPYS